jgi:hypothetical protein
MLHEHGELLLCPSFTPCAPLCRSKDTWYALLASSNLRAAAALSRSREDGRRKSAVASQIRAQELEAERHKTALAVATEGGLAGVDVLIGASRCACDAGN